MTAADPDPLGRGALRDRLRAARRAIDGPRRQDAQRRINRSLVELVELEGSEPECSEAATPSTVGAELPRRRVALSLPTDGEVDLTPAMQELHDAGWEVHLPVVGPDRTMQFAPWQPTAALGRNRFGIDEPVAGPLRSGDELDVVVLPCVGVDTNGHRLGFGAGFYDRALEGASSGVLIAAVFEDQVLERLTPGVHDVPVQLVVTETAVRRVRPAG